MTFSIYRQKISDINISSASIQNDGDQCKQSESAPDIQYLMSESRGKYKSSKCIEVDVLQNKRLQLHTIIAKT